jgi:hypothetical protein
MAPWIDPTTDDIERRLGFTPDPAPRRWQTPDLDTFDRFDDAEPTGAGFGGLLEAIAARQPAWMAEAACRDADRALFFPERGESVEPAKALCAECLTIDECAAYAKSEGMRFGIWAGESARQRTRKAA